MSNDPATQEVSGFGRVVRSVRRDLPMRLLKVIVRVDKVDVVREAVNAAGVPGLTVTEVRGVGGQRGARSHYRGQEYQQSMFPRMEVEAVVPEHLRAAVTADIIAAARTGKVGDGCVFVLPVERSYRIRTGEQDPT